MWMRKFRTAFALVLLGSAASSSGCAVYNVQAKDNEEGKAWVTDGNTIWHCSGHSGGAKCKKVLQ